LKVLIKGLNCSIYSNSRFEIGGLYCRLSH